MARRAPGSSNLATPWKEKDSFEILSGYFNDHHRHAAFHRNQNGNQYLKIMIYLKANHMRPGHATIRDTSNTAVSRPRAAAIFPAALRRLLTLPALPARQVLEKEGIFIGAHALAIHGTKTGPGSSSGSERFFLKGWMPEPPVIDEKAGKARKRPFFSAEGGDSRAAWWNARPAAFRWTGDPFLIPESEMAHMMFSVPAVKAASFGEGFGFASLYGSEANDSLHYEGEHRKP